MAENDLFTDNGKELTVRKLPQGSLWEIYWVKGGKVPMMLRGTWTSKPLAITAIKEYLALDASGKRLQYEETRAKEAAKLAKIKAQAKVAELEKAVAESDEKLENTVFMESGTSL